MPMPASHKAHPFSSSSAAQQGAELSRRWAMARVGDDAPPRFEDLMLDGLGAIDDRVVLLARADPTGRSAASAAPWPNASAAAGAKRG